jgi:hypothetical protein
MQRREQQKALAGALRDANLAWTIPAADRRAGALGQNSQTATGVSMGNADALTRTSIANAGFTTQASIASAQNATSVSIANAGFAAEAARQRAALGQQAWIFNTEFAAQERDRFTRNLFNLLGLQGSGGGGGLGGASFADYGNAALGGAGAFFDLVTRIRGMQGTGNPGVTPAPPTGGNTALYYPSGD